MARSHPDDPPALPVQPVAEGQTPAELLDEHGAVFTPPQLAAAALVGTPITAGLLWFLNGRSLASRRAWLAFVVGFVATLAPFAVAHLSHQRGLASFAFVIWPLGYGILGRLGEGERVRPARSWWLVLPTSVMVLGLLVVIESELAVRGAVVPLLEATDVGISGNVSVHVNNEVDSGVAVDVAAALDAAGFAKEGALRLRLLRTDDGQRYLLKLRLNQVDEKIVHSAQGLAAVVADAVHGCVDVRLVSPGEAVLASGQSCPSGRGLRRPRLSPRLLPD